jgi:hypothetical protein
MASDNTEKLQAFAQQFTGETKELLLGSADEIKQLRLILGEKRCGVSAAANAMSEMQKGQVIDLALNQMEEIERLRNEIKLTKTSRHHHRAKSRWRRTANKKLNKQIYDLFGKNRALREKLLACEEWLGCLQREVNLDGQPAAMEALERALREIEEK